MIKLTLANFKPILNFTQGSAVGEHTLQHTYKVVPQKQFLIAIVGFVAADGMLNDRFVN